VLLVVIGAKDQEAAADYARSVLRNRFRAAVRCPDRGIVRLLNLPVADEFLKDGEFL